jgi:hypothetical protein
LFGKFLDQASQTYADSIVHDHFDDPGSLVPPYATVNKLRLFATPPTVPAAEAIMDVILKTYDAPSPDLTASDKSPDAHDVLRVFADACRTELEQLR